MGQIISRQAELWTPADQIEFQTLVYLHIGRIHTPLKLNCQRVYAQLGESAAQLEPTVSQKEGRGNDHNHGEEEDKIKSGSEWRWRWRQLAEVPSLARYLSTFTTCYMIYVALRYIDPELTSQFISLILGNEANSQLLPPHCYSLGRFIFHPFGSPADRIGGLVFSLAHLVWRTAQHYLRRPHFLTLVLFVQQPDEDLARFYERLEAHNKNQNQRHQPERAAAAAAQAGFDWWRKEDKDRMEQVPAKIDPSSSSSNQLDPFGWSQHELFLLRIMCYRVVIYDNQQDSSIVGQRRAQAVPEGQGRCLYRLRPNRTWAASRELRRAVASSFLTCCIIFACLFAVFFPPIAYLAFSDWHYLIVYRDCDPNLQAKQRAGQVDSWSMSLASSWHRLATIVFDTVECLVIWMDSGLALVYQLSFSFILNKDLLVYWRHLNNKIELILDRVKQRYHHRLQQRQRHYHQHQHPAPGFCLVGKLAPSDNQLDWPDDADLEAAIHELQSECCDFFQQIKSVDLYVSDLLSASLIIWTVATASINQAQYNSRLKQQQSSHSSYPTLVIFAIEFGTFLGMGLVSFELLKLRQSCNKSFRRLCSLMAYDMSAYKGQFRSLLDYFTTKNKAFYTIFQTYPYSRSTYFSLFIWMISCFLVIDNINLKQQQQQQQHYHHHHHQQRAMIGK